MVDHSQWSMHFFFLLRHEEYNALRLNFIRMHLGPFPLTRINLKLLTEIDFVKNFYQ